MEGSGEISYKLRNVDRSGGFERVKRWKSEIKSDLMEVFAVPEVDREVKAGEVARKWSERQAEWEFAALRDPKTNALSRVAAEEVLKREMLLEVMHGDGLGVVMLDLDNYRDVIEPWKNKTPEEVILTEKKGDAGILAFVNLINEFIDLHKEDEEFSTKNIKLFRMGGEEFMLLIPNIHNEENLRKILEALRKKTEDELAKNAGIEELKSSSGGKQTVSIGAVVVNKVAAVSDVLNIADEALYKAKQRGRNNVQIGDKLEGTMDKLPLNQKWNDRWLSAENRPERIDELTAEYTTEILENGQKRNYAELLAHKFDEMEQNVVCDDLTGVYHRGAGAQMIQEVIDLESDHDHQVGLALFNIDDFTGVNSEFGHDTGDKVLKEFVKITNEILENSGLVGFQVRWKPGGEFLVSVAHGTSYETIVMVANEIGVRVRDNLAKRIKINNKNITVSAGVCLAGSKISDAVLQLIRLEQTAKENGRNCMAIMEDGSEEIVKFS